MSIDLDDIAQDELMKTRLCDLGLQIKDTVIEEYVEALYSELKQKGMKFLPPCYLSDEWFSPVDVAAIAIPFYLAHPALMSLEKKMMSQVEGGTREEAMKFLRHECGHAYVHAFSLHRKLKWREIFGHPGKTYNEHYHYRPYSKSFVQNLKDFYAQSHPEEDFSETFAVWLNPESNWKKTYRGWKAFDKLQYVNELMDSLKDRTVQVYKKDLYYHIKTIKKRLSLHYERKRKLYIEDVEDFFDSDLKKIFHLKEGKGRNAYKLLTRNRRRIEALVCRYTGEKKYIVSALLSKLIKRIRTLTLKYDGKPEDILIEFSIYVAALSSNHLYTSRFKKV